MSCVRRGVVARREHHATGVVELAVGVSGVGRVEEGVSLLLSEPGGVSPTCLRRDGEF